MTRTTTISPLPCSGREPGGRGVRYLSVCSGIEAATVAWHPLGWEPVAFSEIEPFPRAVLQNHYPKVPLHGDFTTIQGDEYGPVQLLVGGTPCQSFSVAGLRGGLADPRGNLVLGYLALAKRLGARWLVWENVPGVLSSNGGRDFGSFLGGLGKLGYGFAYRVLDAQFFGLAQRRRRVFVVAHLGDWRPAAAVLFERHGLQGHPAPRRGEGASAAALTARGVGTCGADDNQAQAGHLIASNTGDIAACLTNTPGRYDLDTETFVCHGTQDPDVLDNLAHPLGRNQGQENAVSVTGSTTHALTAEGHDASEDGSGRGTPVVGVALRGRDGGATAELTGDVMTALRCGGGGGDKPHVLAPGMAVRRLTPVECERLQGFPDGYTAIPTAKVRRIEADELAYIRKHFPDMPEGEARRLAADGPRYKALGNSMAVPVMAWIGQRIAAVEQITATTNQQKAA